MHDPGALTYIVLDVPEPQASAVMSIRRAHRDLFRAALPVEITLTDSIDPSQDPDDAFEALEKVAAESQPIQTSFLKAHRFPDSDTFVMRLADEMPFRDLRKRILSTGIAFQPSDYEFMPHCTLRTRSPVSDEDARVLLGTEISGPMVLDSLSIYTLTRAATPSGVSCDLRQRLPLGDPRVDRTDLTSV
jgi:2'-5' RNA ligase